MSAAALREKLSLSMDGVILTTPPKDLVDKMNYCRHGEEYMWRKPAEAALPELAGDDPYGQQVPLGRAVPMWGGISGGGFAIVTLHKKKKLTADEWAGYVKAGKLRGAIKRIKPVKPHGPWAVLCDNEGFLNAAKTSAAHRVAKVMLWRVPPRCPDLNPVEKFWGWLRPIGAGNSAV